MNGWYFVYILMCALNGVFMASEGVSVNNFKFWIWVFVPILAYFAGKSVALA